MQILEIPQASTRCAYISESLNEKEEEKRIKLNMFLQRMNKNEWGIHTYIHTYLCRHAYIVKMTAFEVTRNIYVFTCLHTPLYTYICVCVFIFDEFRISRRIFIIHYLFRMVIKWRHVAADQTGCCPFNCQIISLTCQISPSYLK